MAKDRQAERCGCGRSLHHVGHCAWRRLTPTDREGLALHAQLLDALDEIHLACIKFAALYARWTASGRPLR